jgi:hypothetical protein
MKETQDMTEKRKVYSRLVELETLLTNALGALTESVEIRSGKIPKPKKVNVESLVAKPTKGAPTETVYKGKNKLMPNNEAFYKAPAFDESGEAPVEPPTQPEDSQDKEIEAALTTALEALEKFRGTLSIEAADAMQPTMR